ncbi:MAG TPA: hypothetical protein VGC21_23705 [Telluria sp.]|jgi:hypothetical protein
MTLPHARLSQVKRIASWLLLLAFVLPLSKCTGRVDPDTLVQSADTVNYGFSLLVEFARGFELRPFDAVRGMLAVLAVFFGPLCTLAMRPLWEPLFCLAGAVLAWYALAVWVFLIGHPMPGGWLACACWVAVVLVSVAQLWTYGKRRFTPLARQG